VIANGEIWTLQDYLRCKEQSQCSDFMLGRGLLANPGLACEIKAHENGADVKAMPWTSITPYLQHFLDVTSAIYPKKYMGNRVKQWLHYLQRNYAEAHWLFESIKREKCYDTISSAIAASNDVKETIEA